ncbi:heme NO-binding domain-containing protein [Marinobacter bohaiensis]|uniref:heme NO-binding domain-containing protein n=1 Tax=Marinobacter bohaiensis TaxID=2201898 RepID=UPI0013A6B6F9|nr:heme NO-binding domain-containing protein [Marinobacter bohaiensis]
MIGLIQKVLLELVESEGGPEALAEVRAKAELAPGQDFRIDTDYDDGQCLRLIRAAQSHFQLDEEALWALYADYFINISRRMFPMFYQVSGSARDFLKRQPAVHATLAAGLRDEDERDRVRDKFSVREQGDRLLVTYGSPNRLCGLYEALFRRLLQEYGETGQFVVERCRKRGDAACRFCLQVEAAGD